MLSTPVLDWKPLSGHCGGVGRRGVVQTTPRVTGESDTGELFLLVVVILSYVH